MTDLTATLSTHFFTIIIILIWIEKKCWIVLLMKHFYFLSSLTLIPWSFNIQVKLIIINQCNQNRIRNIKIAFLFVYLPSVYLSYSFQVTLNCQLILSNYMNSEQWLSINYLSTKFVHLPLYICHPLQCWFLSTNQ